MAVVGLLFSGDHRRGGQPSSAGDLAAVLTRRAAQERQRGVLRGCPPRPGGARQVWTTVRSGITEGNLVIPTFRTV